MTRTSTRLEKIAQICSAIDRHAYSLKKGVDPTTPPMLGGLRLGHRMASSSSLPLKGEARLVCKCNRLPGSFWATFLMGIEDARSVSRPPRHALEAATTEKE
jgi:hypothetical protein